MERRQQTVSYGPVKHGMEIVLLVLKTLPEQLTSSERLLVILLYISNTLQIVLAFKQWEELDDPVRTTILCVSWWREHCFIIIVKIIYYCIIVSMGRKRWIIYERNYDVLLILIVK